MFIFNIIIRSQGLGLVRGLVLMIVKSPLLRGVLCGFRGLGVSQINPNKNINSSPPQAANNLINYGISKMVTCWQRFHDHLYLAPIWAIIKYGVSFKSCEGARAQLGPFAGEARGRCGARMGPTTLPSGYTDKLLINKLAAWGGKGIY